MARVIWTGSLAFGLVNIPIGLYSATEDKTVHFNQFQKGTSDRIRYKRVNERTGEEVNYRDIVKGREVDEDTYVLVTDEELEAVEPERTRTIDITDFVDLAQIDPIYYQRTYYLAPRGNGAERPYELLHQAMAEANRAGIATFVMRSKEYLVAVRPQQEILALETMYFADEIRDAVDATGYEPSGHKPRERELKIARQLIESMTTDWDPDNYGDTYRERVEELIESKRKGEEVATEAPPPRESKVVDLTETLRRSVEAARGRRGGGSGGGQDRARDASGGTGSGRGSGTRGGSGGRRRGAKADQGTPGDDLAAMNKSQLSALAAELDISGRSRMSRDELAAAIGEARRRRPKAVS
ncbi:MAG TPA: Ku protein [Streptosporangiaceae bacterium]|nr:Ku protein [Streptosporangiaceae bacterium]